MSEKDEIPKHVTLQWGRTKDVAVLLDGRIFDGYAAEVMQGAWADVYSSDKSHKIERVEGNFTVVWRVRDAG